MLNLQPPTFEEFELEASRGNCVPVVRTVLADLQTPVGAFLRIAADARYAFLLESVEGGERVARHSFLGANPEMVVRGAGDRTTVERNGKLETVEGTRATDFLKDYFSNRKLVSRADLPPLSGGAVGYISYDAARWFEPVLEDGMVEADDAVMMVYRTVLAFDRVKQQILITSVVFTDEAEGNREALKRLYERAVNETESIEKVLLTGAPYEQLKKEAPASKTTSFESNWTKQDFEKAVTTIKELIAAGECYQVVLSQKFSKNVSAQPIEIYRALRATNPSPYTFFLKLGDESLIGASPEMLVRSRGRRLEYRPIAGTRPRGATEAQDHELGQEMRNDEKEMAEHMMLVDLGRNDLGRVSEFGSVEVAELMTIEKYSHVQHLVTALRSELRRDLDRFDAFSSCFPAGTVTGAPKIRAMEIIRDLEPAKRRVYAGSVLYMDYGDNLDSCIAIRTIVLKGNHAEVQAGAGIVADSVPEREYEETINKAKALLRAIDMAEKGL
jgi:anthranilate synthase component I